MSEQQPQGVDRRTLLKRTALTGGAMVWTVPAVQSIVAPAFASSTGSPLCSLVVGFNVPGSGDQGCTLITSFDSAFCEALAYADATPPAPNGSTFPRFLAVVSVLIAYAGRYQTSGNCTPPTP